MVQRVAGSCGRRIVSGKERMTADADAVIISGAERSRASLATLARSLGLSLAGLSAQVHECT